MFNKNLLLVFSLSLFISFVLFSYLVAKESFTQFDFDSTVRLQDEFPRKVDFIFSLFSVIGSVEVTGIFMFILLLLFLVKKYWLTAISLFLLPIALLLEIFGKVFVYHPGPPYLFYRGVIRFDFFPTHYVPHQYSYPSGHMLRISFILSFFAIFALLKLPKKISYCLIVFFLGIYILMAISRVYLGEHWTSDVVGGALLGSSFGVLSALTIPIKKANVSHNE